MPFTAHRSRWFSLVTALAVGVVVVAATTPAWALTAQSLVGRNEIGRDDVLLAGMLVDRIQRQGELIYQQNAQALTARETWLQAFALPRAIGAEPMEAQELAEQLRDSDGGKNLADIGLEDDILATAYLDRYEGVPEMDPEKPRIRLPLGDT